MTINVDLIYPVGSIYMNVIDGTNPGEIFGGTWKPIPYRYLIGQGTIEKNNYNGYGSVDDYAGVWGILAGQTFGEIKHKLTYEEMPVHQHAADNFIINNTYHPISVGSGSATIGIGDYGTYVNAAGSDYPHNNMPPSLAVYMWQRIA